MRQKTHFHIKRGTKGRVGGGGGCSRHEFTNNNVAFHESRNIVYLISTTCLGDFCAAINSLGKPAVGGSERTGAKLHKKDSKVKLHQAAKC